MSKLRYFSQYIQSPKNILAGLMNKFGQWLPDELFVKWKYWISMDKKLNISSPKTFNEKLNWQKLYDHNPLYTTLVDKYSVKKWVAEKIGDQYVIPTLAVWEKPEDIEWDTLPDQFVLKTTHGGGNIGVVICKDKSGIDKSQAIKKLNYSMRQDAYTALREWPYKNVQKRIIAEKFVEDQKTGELRDYKFFCTNGVVRALFIATGRQTNKEPYFDYYDADFNHLDLRQCHPMSGRQIEKPVCFEEMKRIASILSTGIPQVRVDLYEVNNRVYFGEMTFFHHGGVVPFHPESWDYTWGDWITLPEKRI